MKYDPSPSAPKQMVEIAQSNAVLIVNNSHNPLEDSLKRVAKIGDYKRLPNFS
jgi:hypothetical protein